ncbi:MAG: hypothetical protein QOH36_2168 [Actinomycetota bacterium]|nr:hypothetical protein [Actinomycetota bacterium]
MDERWGRVVFTADGRPFTWDDVAAHARGRGTWSTLERETADGLTAAARADPSRGDVRAAEVGFRQARRLIAAEDTERWLAERQLTIAEWRAWVRRDLCRRTPPDGTDASVEAVNTADVAAAVWVTGWCTGILEDLAGDLADRVAARGAIAEGGVDLDPDDAYDQLAAAAAGDEAVKASVASHLLDWMALDGDWLSFPDEDAAREGLVCLREDGMGMDELAEAVGTAAVRRRTVIADLDHAWRLRFLSSQPGDHLGPVPVDDGLAIVAVRAKVMPSVDDGEVRERARRVLVARAVEREREKRVRWREPL